jgi:hypothetical protein
VPINDYAFSLSWRGGGMGNRDDPQGFARRQKAVAVWEEAAGESLTAVWLGRDL